MTKRLLSVLLGAGTMWTVHGIGNVVHAEQAPNQRP